MTRAAYIIQAVRTPIGRYGGSLAKVRTDDLLAIAIRALLDRQHGLTVLVEDVLVGCANQAGEDNRNVARMSLLLAGLPVAVPGATVNRLCGSGMQAVNDAARLILNGEADVVIAGGVEHMTRAPMVMAKPAAAWQRGDAKLYDTTLGWRFINPRLEEKYGVLSMGETAEAVAAKHGVTRAAQDELALGSQLKAAQAARSGRLAREIVPVLVDGKTIAIDEHPRPDTTLAALAALKPAFKKDGTVTAGNSAGINDGAAALLLASERAVTDHGWKPLARWVASGAAGVEPSYMGLGPIPAAQRALARAGLRAADIDYVELNEAFAAQVIPCIQELGLDPAKVNVNGGSIALGHPLGASGARLVGTLAHELALGRGRFALAAMCIGVGQGIAAVLERA
ncbi:MAG TPA: acetyl-CoA C-acyltransferase [Haliangiales bacterium]|nr:acetyl-CoA C-acyltransferase [Haliangiales bacterium]